MESLSNPKPCHFKILYPYCIIRNVKCNDITVTVHVKLLSFATIHLLLARSETKNVMP